MSDLRVFDVRCPRCKVSGNVSVVLSTEEAGPCLCSPVTDWSDGELGTLLESANEARQNEDGPSDADMEAWNSMESISEGYERAHRERAALRGYGR